MTDEMRWDEMRVERYACIHTHVHTYMQNGHSLNLSFLSPPLSTSHLIYLSTLYFLSPTKNLFLSTCLSLISLTISHSSSTFPFLRQSLALLSLGVSLRVYNWTRTRMKMMMMMSPPLSVSDWTKEKETEMQMTVKPILYIYFLVPPTGLQTILWGWLLLRALLEIGTAGTFSLLYM